jgi:hypothetical protein
MDFIASFHKALPVILGSVFDSISCAIKNLPHTHIKRIPRMADFAIFATAAESSMPWTPGLFLEDYFANRDEIIKGAIGSNQVEKAILAFLKSKSTQEWKGNATELLEELNKLSGAETYQKDRNWPKAPNTLSGIINRIAPVLRANDVFYRMGKSDGKKYIYFKSLKSTELSSLSSHNDENISNNSKLNRDDTRDDTSKQSSLSSHIQRDDTRDDRDDTQNSNRHFVDIIKNSELSPKNGNLDDRDDSLIQILHPQNLPSLCLSLKCPKINGNRCLNLLESPNPDDCLKLRAEMQRRGSCETRA